MKILSQISSLILILLIFVSCNTNNNVKELDSKNKNLQLTKQEIINPKYIQTNKVSVLGLGIRSIMQDKRGIYWFGTDMNGVYRYDGKVIIHFTDKDGLANNQIHTIQEDNLGNIWFGTGGFAINRFDGQKFTTFLANENMNTGIGISKEWKIQDNDLWFYAGGGAYRYFDNSISYLPLPKSNIDKNYKIKSPNTFSSYALYASLKDSKGNLWFGTQEMGVCRFDGSDFTWFTEKGLSGPAVRSIFEDKSGNLWFGNNGYGLFKYDGKTLTNFTEQNGLSNKDFVNSGILTKSNPGTLARVWSINEDDSGNLWFGTIDSGVWKYDGKNLVNYTRKDGLPNNAINVIYKDNQGVLWFGTEGAGVYKFDGKKFISF